MKKIILVSGDPNSINSEIIFKVWRKLNINIKKRLYLIGNYSLILSQFKKLKFKTNLEKVKNIEKNNNLKLKIIDIPLKFKDPFNVPPKNSSDTFYKAYQWPIIFVKKIKLMVLLIVQLIKNY